MVYDGRLFRSLVERRLFPGWNILALNVREDEGRTLGNQTQQVVRDFELLTVQFGEQDQVGLDSTKLEMFAGLLDDSLQGV